MRFSTILIVLTILSNYSCKPKNDSAIHLSDKYIAGKISVLHSKQEKYSGIVTSSNLSTDLSFMYDFNVDFSCDKLKIGQKVYFKLVNSGGIVVANNLSITKPKDNQISQGAVDTKGLKGIIELSRKYSNHIDSNCITIRELHTKFHYYKQNGDTIVVGREAYIPTLWTNVFRGSIETTLFLKLSTYNEIRTLLENSTNSFEGGWYIMHNGGLITDISLTHDH